MKPVIVIPLISLVVFSVSSLQAQSGWKKNAAGHDVYEYKPAKPEPYKEPVKKTTTTTITPVPVKTERITKANITNVLTVTKLRMTLKKTEIKENNAVFPPYGTYTGGYDNIYLCRVGPGRMEVFNNGPLTGVYEGEWYDDQFEGSFTDADGGVFKGSFINLQPGPGVAYYYLGNKFDGPVYHGKVTGAGVVITYPDGSFYTGDVAENMRHGDGSVRTVDERVLFSGKWKYDNKHGEGWEIIDDKTYKKGSWQMGKESGPFTILTIGSNSVVKTVQYDNGEIVKPGTKKKVVVPAKTVIKTAPVPPALKAILKDGKTYVPGGYAATIYASEGLGSVNVNGKRGFVDQTDLLIIPLLYEEVGHFVKGRVGVKLNGKWGFIDKEGKIIVPLIYKEVYDYTNGVARGILPGETAFIYFDWEGKIITK